jgi:hypothetical protein
MARSYPGATVVMEAGTHSPSRMDPTLLHPIEHGSQEAQQDMLQLKLRDNLVRARVALINAVRFT